ncbi:MAG: hypothetical protein ABL959_12345 [Pyrinomonadaceae bacterium]
MEKGIALLNALMKAAGDITLSEAVTWLEVKENAERLLAEGHEDESPNA